MLAEPCPWAVTKPDEGSTVATPVLSLLHVPPVVPPVEVKVAVAPKQRGVVPETVPAETLGAMVTVALTPVKICVQAPLVTLTKL